jgi:LuxR family maltose regulon positive regulatory protein
MNVLGEVLDIKGEAESAAEYYLQAFEAGCSSCEYLGALVLFTNLILTLNELGRRCEADDRCKRLAESIDLQSAPESSLLNSIYLSWSLLKYEENQLEFAREHVLKALNLLKATNFPQGIIWGQYILAQVYMAEGKFDLLRNISKEGQKLASQIGRGEGRGIWFTALEAQADLIEGNLSRALHWVEKTGLSYQDVPNRWNEYVYFTYVKILLAQERFTEAEVLLKTMEQSILATNRNRKMITVNILYSQLLAAQSRHEEAKSRMADAVILAAPQDYTRAFLSEGKNIHSLLTEVHFTVPTFVGSLLLTLQGSPDSASQIPGSYESLTEREQEILQMVSKGFSNREIASGLFISLGTVKKHLNNIFSKLDVKNRTQAVNRGIELGLFS